MKTVSGYILTKYLGWAIQGEFPDMKKSIIIYAPHTSFMDAIYGKLYFNEACVQYRFTSKKELFFFPMNILMKMFGSIPVRGVKNKNAVFHIAKMLRDSDELHIIISPEGTRAKVLKWNYGFYYMAAKANVPIVVGYLDYEKKELGVKGVMYDLTDIGLVKEQMNNYYRNITAKYPEKFSVECLNEDVCR